MHPYNILELATPVGFSRSMPTAINNSGVVVGYSERLGLGRPRATKWKNNLPSVLPLPKAGKSSAAFGINDDNEIVGYVSFDNISYDAARWKSGTVKVISQGARLISYAWTVNNAGVIGGESDRVPCKWIGLTKTGMNGLPVAASPSGTVTAITSSGQAFGAFEDPERVAARWDTAGVFTDLTGSGYRSEVAAANDAEMAVGYTVDTSGLTTAQYWSPAGNGSFTTADSGTSMAFDINAIGQAVGEFTTPPLSARACLWTGSVLTDLNHLIDPSLGWTLWRAVCLNDAGVIGGYGELGGKLRGWIMVPRRPVRRPPPPIFWHLVFGVVGDGGGVVIGPGGPSPVPPWGTLLRLVPNPYRGLLEDLLRKPRPIGDIGVGPKDRGR